MSLSLGGTEFLTLSSGRWLPSLITSGLNLNLNFGLICPQTYKIFLGGDRGFQRNWKFSPLEVAADKKAN